MIPLNCILSTMDLVYKLPQIAAIICALILLAAFFIGFAKGVKRVGWEWMTCLAGFVGFAALDGYLRANSKALKLPMFGKMSAATATTFVLAFAFLALVLILYGVCSALFRPREVWVRKDRFLFRRDQKAGRGNGNPKRLVYRNYAPPKFFGRLLGGVVCMVNTGVIVALVLSIFLLFIYGTAIVNLNLGGVLKVQISQIVLKYAMRYALDFITLCIPFFLACYGYKRGFVSSLRTIVFNAGSILIIVAAFWLPFSPLVGKSNLNFLGKLIDRCAAILGGVPEQFRPFVAKLIAGVFLLLFFTVIFLFVNHILVKYEKSLEKASFMKGVDSVVSCVLYFLIGVALCVLLWAGLYALDVCKIFKISEVLGEDAVLSKELLNFVKTFMDQFLKPFLKTA